MDYRQRGPPMEFTELQQTIHEFGTAMLVILYGLRLISLVRQKKTIDLSHPKGDVRRGILEAFAVLIMPQKMESTRIHRVRYIEFVVFHIGVFANIVLSFAVAYAPGLLVLTVRAAGLFLLAASLLAGTSRLCRRATRPEMRIISSPDDYVAISMVLLFLLTGMLMLLRWEPGIIAYFILSALFLVYEPFSKIRHYIYYPFVRFFYGTTFSRLGILGENR